MAPDRSTDPEGGYFPSDASRALLRQAVTDYVDSRDEAPVCHALDAFGQEARERELFAERMLVTFKRLLDEMPEVRAIANERERQRLRDRLVTLCISAYYQRQ